MSFDELVALWSGRAAVSLTAVAALAGILAWMFSNRANAEKEAALRRFQSESRAAISAADARAAEATVRAADATARAAVASTAAAEATERTARVETEAAKQQERAAKAEKDLLELQERLAPRILNPAQVASIGSALKPLGTYSAQVFTYADITEVMRIGDNIAAALNAAGWSVGLAKASGGVTVTGIVVAATRSSAQARSAATRLVQELQRNGIAGTLAAQPLEDIPGPGMAFGNQVNGAQIRVLIGTK